MKDLLNHDARQSTESQSEGQPNEKQIWVTPLLSVIDINEETALGNNNPSGDLQTSKS